MEEGVQVGSGGKSGPCMLARTSLKGTVLFGSCRGAEWVPGGVLGGLETREVEGTMNAYWNGSSTHELDDGIWIRRCREL